MISGWRPPTITSLTRSRGPSNRVARKPTISNTTFRAQREGLATRIEWAMVKIKLLQLHGNQALPLPIYCGYQCLQHVRPQRNTNEMPQNQQSNRRINIVYFQLLSTQGLFKLHCSARCRCCNTNTREEKFRECEAKFHTNLRFE